MVPSHCNGGLYTPPHIPVGLRMDSGKLQMAFYCSSTISFNFFFGGNPRGERNYNLIYQADFFRRATMAELTN